MTVPSREVIFQFLCDKVNEIMLANLQLCESYEPIKIEEFESTVLKYTTDQHSFDSINCVELTISIDDEYSVMFEIDEIEYKSGGEIADAIIFWLDPKNEKPPLQSWTKGFPISEQH